MSYKNLRAAAPVAEETGGLIVPPPAVTLAAAPSNIGALIDPDAVPGTRFTGPLMSGPLDQIAGIAPLIKRARFTAAQHGSFSVPVQLPASSVLLACYTMIEQTFNGLTPTMKLEATPGGSIYVGPVDLTVAPTTLTTPITGLLTSTWTFYLTVALGAGSTAGKATVMVMYSVPGMATPS